MPLLPSIQNVTDEFRDVHLPDVPVWHSSLLAVPVARGKSRWTRHIDVAARLCPWCCTYRYASVQGDLLNLSGTWPTVSPEGTCQELLATLTASEPGTLAIHHPNISRTGPSRHVQALCSCGRTSCVCCSSELLGW